jgi:hypothetical protein
VDNNSSSFVLTITERHFSCFAWTVGAVGVLWVGHVERVV